MEDLRQYYGDIFTIHGVNELHQPIMSSQFLEKKWQKGYVQISDATQDTMNYVARYTTKKALGNEKVDCFGLMPEFCAMSRRPGLGSEYAKTHDIDEKSCVCVRNGKKIFWPKKVLEYAMSEHWSIDVPFQGEVFNVKFDTPQKRYYDFMERRKIDAFHSIENDMKQTGLSYSEQLKVALNNTKERVKILSRKDPVEIKQNKEYV